MNGSGKSDCGSRKKRRLEGEKAKQKNGRMAFGAGLTVKDVARILIGGCLQSQSCHKINFSGGEFQIKINSTVNRLKDLRSI
jgi:hypothetical protein